LLALLGAHPILHVGKIRVKETFEVFPETYTKDINIMWERM
jgi:hypothetical protein